MVPRFNLDSFYKGAQQKSWRRVPAKMFLREVDIRSETGEEEVLGLSGSKGVLKRSEMGQRASGANSYIGYKKVTPGQLISNKMQAWNGMFGISPYEGITSPDYAIYEFTDRNDPRFLEYTVRTRLYAAEFHCRSKGMGTGFLRLNPGEFLSTPFWLPDRETQKSIAHFLDRETARIDQLIKKKQRLVELIDEKRSTLVTAAITGHLDPTTGQRQTPEGGHGMRMVRLRHLATVLNSNVDKVVDESEIPVRLCNYVDVYKNDFIDTNLAFSAGSATKAEIERFRLRVGDVLITKDSEDRLDIGVPAYVRESADDLVCGYHLSLIRAKAKVMRGNFLFWALQSKHAKDSFSNAAYGITRYGLTLNGIKSLTIHCPDLATQKAIADFLDRETARFDEVKTKTNRSIERLREYRAALITAAVTGQIDVASWSKRGEADRRLDKIEEDMTAPRATKQVEARA